MRSMRFIAFLPLTRVSKVFKESMDNSKEKCLLNDETIDDSGNALLADDFGNVLLADDSENALLADDVNLSLRSVFKSVIVDYTPVAIF